MTKSREEKFQRLQDLVLDLYISELESGSVSVKDAAPIITFLKNNRVQEEKNVLSESDIIDELVE